MRTALLSGLLTAIAYVLLDIPGIVSNVDFTYMAVGAAMLFDGKLPASPYFPPGYPALVWLLLHLGLSALWAGALLSALGIGLIAAAVSYTARLWTVPPAPALMLGLLAGTMPTMLLVGVNPHLDALYAGLGAVLLACAMRALARPPNAWVYVGTLLCGVLMLSLRYHGALVVLPVAFVLLFSRRKGVLALGLTLLLVACASLAGSLYALHSVTGSYRTAAMDQVRTGSAYRQLKTEAAMDAQVYEDYAGWQRRWPQADARMIAEGIVANWPQYLLRKSILAGVAIWLLALAIRRREMPGAVWLLVFILGYTLAISPTYYITRASGLPEAAGMLLVCAGLAVLLFPPAQKNKRKTQQVDPALAGALIAAAAVAGMAYNVWREAPILAQHWPRARVYEAVNHRALELVGYNRRQLYGVVHSTGIYGTGRFNLPAVCWSRLWMDDPAVAPMVDPYLPKLAPQDVLAGHSHVTAIVLWRTDNSVPSQMLATELGHSAIWQEVPLGTDEARLWRRRMSEPAKAKDQTAAKPSGKPAAK